jgi:hypothetical protein
MVVLMGEAHVFACDHVASCKDIIAWRDVAYG